MGLLDDAIREHLELKRKHGAAEEELSQQETEALGPARRDFSAPAPPAEDLVEADELSGEAEAPAAAEPVGWLEDEPGAAPFDAAAEPAPPAEPAGPAAPREPLAPSAREAPVEPPPAPPLEESAAAEPPPAPVSPRRESDTPTQGFPALRPDAEADESEEGEDVLEETPEFLQDTPEHDRLWFEQKPPRDFDFDD